MTLPKKTRDEWNATRENYRLKEKIGFYQVGLSIAIVLGSLGWLLWLGSL
jgi:hypothetical protein